MSPNGSAPSSSLSEPAPGKNRWERASRRLGPVLYILLCIEIGSFLFFMPWSSIWDRSLLLRHYPQLRPIFLSAYLRGAVSGLGIINLWLGVSQAWHLRRTPAAPLSPEQRGN